LDRAALLFQAGKEASQADQRRWPNRERCWQTVAASLALVVCGLGWNTWRASSRIVERERFLPAPTVANVVSDKGVLSAQTLGRNRSHYLQQRFVALRHGLDELDGDGSAGRSEAFENRQYRDLVDEYLRNGDDL